MKSRFIYIPVFFISAILVYFSAITAHYAFRDDYSITRETHEEPGKVLVFTTSHGRPLYGLLLDSGYRYVRSIDDLQWFRLLSAVLIAGFALLLFGQLQKNGWDFFESAVVSLIVLFLPASQVTISWAVGWPWGISLMFAVLGFRFAETALNKTGAVRMGYIAAAIFLYTLATEIYQSDTLFAVVLLASLLLSPTFTASKAETVKHTIFHLSILGAGLLLGYAFVMFLFSTGVFKPSGRLEFETHYISKLQWFFTQSVPNALAFLTLRDDFNTGAVLFWIVFSVVLLLILAALVKQYRRKNIFNGLLCLFLLPWVAHSISLAAAERSLGYRTTYALSGLAVVLLIAAIRELFPGAWRRGLMLAIVIVMAIQAHQQSYHLIAEPQNREWKMVKDAVAKMKPGVPTAVYMIEPKMTDRSTDRVFRDEFGSFTSNSSWTPDEMFKHAMRERFPHGIPKNWNYVFYHGGEPPPPTDHYDLVIDERTLKKWRK